MNKINLLLTEENSHKEVELTNEEPTKSSDNQADSLSVYSDLKDNDSNKIIIDEDSTNNQFRLEL